MVLPGQAILNAVEDYENNRQRIIRETVAVKQHEMMTTLQLDTIKKMDEDAMNLPAGQFNAERYLEDFNTKSANLLNQFEDKENRLRFQDMTNQIRGQIGLKANKYELRSLKESQKIAKENLYNTGVQQLYETMQNGGDVLEAAPTFFTQADALKPNLSFSEQQDLEVKKGDYAVLTMTLRADQAMKQLLNDNIDIDEYSVFLNESKRIVNDYPLSADQRVKVNDIFSSEEARMITIATTQDVKNIKQNFDGYKLEYIRTGKIDPKFYNKLAKYAQKDPSLQGFLLELETVKQSRGFYNAQQIGDLRTMRGELERARQEADPAASDGAEYARRDQRFQKLNVDYQKALKKRDENFADFYKENPRVKYLKMQGIGSGDMRPYVSYMQALAAEQGLDPNDIELIDNNQKQAFKERFTQIGRDVNEARRLAYGIDQMFGPNANKVFEEILHKNSDVKLNALRYRQDESFGKVWEAATLPKEEVEGRAQYLKLNDPNFKVSTEKFKIPQQLKNYYDTRIAQNDPNIGARIVADTELGYRMRLSGVESKDVAEVLANKNFSYVKNNSINVRIPKERDTPVLRNVLSKPNLVKNLVRSKAADLELTNLPFTEAEQKNLFNQEPKAAINIATGVLGMVSPSAAVAFNRGAKELSKQIPKKSLKDLKNKVIEESLVDNAMLVNDENGFKLMTRTSLETQTLQMVPLKDKNGQVIRFTYDEMETMMGGSK
jgi:hypothetical protein